MARFILEDISSRDYRIHVTEKREGGGIGLVIQHAVVRGDYVNISGAKALDIYKELKKSLRGGKTPAFNKKCGELILESRKPEVIEAPKPTNQLIIKLYAGDVLVREINSEEAWIAALNSTIKVS